ncbi:MAG: hypothetical protein H6697_09860 [Myxococcales bacterium]|nr:hypothetical protein [Myxococcales bacterium]
MSDPTPRRIHGLDVSGHQPRVRYDVVAKAGYAYAWIKASEGAGWRDPMFAAHWSGFGAEGVGILRGAYHFLRYEKGATAAKQVDAFLGVVGDRLDEAEMPLVLDFEGYGKPGEGTSIMQPAQIVPVALEALRLVEERTGLVPMLYTGRSWFALMRDGYRERRGVGAAMMAEFLRYPLWLAAYAAKPTGQPPRASEMHPWTVWQWTGSGTIPGGVLDHRGRDARVDLNVFDGTEEQLCALRTERWGRA